MWNGVSSKFINDELSRIDINSLEFLEPSQMNLFVHEGFIRQMIKPSYFQKAIKDQTLQIKFGFYYVIKKNKNILALLCKYNNSQKIDFLKYFFTKIIINMSIYFESAFNTNQSHIAGCQIQIATAGQSFFSYANDEVMCQYSLTQPPVVTTIQNPISYQICKFAIHPTQKNTFIVGSANGYVLSLTHNKATLSYQISSSKILYKIPNANPKSNDLLNRIRSLVFTSDGKYLLIATNQSYCIVYQWKKKQFFKHKLQTDTQIISINVDYRNQYICLIDIDGKASVYKFQKQQKPQQMQLQQNMNQDNSDSQDPFAQMNSKQQKIAMKYLACCTIASPVLMKKHFNSQIQASFNFIQTSFLTQTLYLPGQNTLQKMQLNLPPASFSYKYDLMKDIVHTKEILKVLWLKNQNCQQGLLITATQVQAIVWHESKGEKLMKFTFSILFDKDNLQIKSLCVRRFRDHSNWGFVIIPKYIDTFNVYGAKVYDFKGFSLLQAEISKKTKQINQNQNQVIEEALQQNSKKRRPNKQQTKPRPFQSIAAKLLPIFPQMFLPQGYQEHDRCKFLFYNNFGCIIQRTDPHLGSSLLQFQFHDRSKITRIKLPSDKQYQFFALCTDTLVYASSSTIHVQCQKYLKQNFQWQYECQNVQGVSIGGEWICAVNKGSIKILDWTGNQLHCVDFDRKYIAMAAYQDQLAVVYHSSLPMYGVQSFKMMIFEVTTKTLRMVRDTMLVLKPNCNLKWFGYSQEGMIVAQDDGQNLRVYNYTKDFWQLTISLDTMAERLFIQHVQNYQLYGFKLQQKFPNQPRVFPRSLPKKINFDLSNHYIQYLTLQENQYIKKHKLSLMWLEHEKYRYSKWYKYKYSRNKQNRWYQRSISIKNQQQIKISQAQLDLKLMEYFKKFIKINKNKQDDQVWKKVLFLCQSLAYYQQSKSKLIEILSQSDVRAKPSRQLSNNSCKMNNPQIPLPKKKKLSQLDRLQELMGLSWANLKQKQPMELQH